MRILGHTMGTPDRSVVESLRLFAELGLDGADVVVQDGYLSGIAEHDDRQVDLVGRAAEDLGVPVAALTPYVWGINSLDEDERRHEIVRLRRAIDVAARLGATRIRVYSGSYAADERPQQQQKWDLLVDALIQLGSEAADRGVVLCCENHFSTMTVSAAQTARLVGEVDSPGVKALYDQANLAFTHQESFEQAIDLQAELIGHVHVKDFVFIDPDRPFVAAAVDRVTPEERAVRSRVVGDGVLAWRAILARLLATGYSGDLSLEYEYRWHPQDLPPPEEGFKVGADRVRAWLADIEKERP